VTGSPRIGASIAICEAPRRLAAGQNEGNPQGHRRESVGQIVNRVGQQGRASAGDGDARLKRCGCQQAQQRDFERPDALVCGKQGVVRHAMCM
jgi:hypothetical protein